MGAHVIDAVIVLNVAVFVKMVNRPQTIFRNKNRLVVTVINAVQRNAQSNRIDGLSPLGFWQIRILDVRDKAACWLGNRGAFVPHNIGHIIADCDKINRAILQNL